MMAEKGGRIKLSWGEVVSREPACVECGVSWMESAVLRRWFHTRYAVDGVA